MPRQDSGPKKHVESGVPPFIQYSDHISGDLTFCQEHLEHLVQGFHIRIRGLGIHKKMIEQYRTGNLEQLLCPPDELKATPFK